MPRDLNDTLVFVKVVEHGSFIGAARALGMPKTTVSRRVQALEERLGAQLLHRTTRSLGLTEAGALYHEMCQRIARELDEAESAVGQLQAGPRGWLRVTMGHSLATHWIAPLLPEFRARYPEVRVELVASSDLVDLIGQEIDLALRVGPLADSTLVARRLAVLRTQVYASPAYLERNGEPRHPDDLIRHRILARPRSVRHGPWTWTLSDGQQVVEARIDPVVVANDPGPIRSALLAGEGLALVSDIMMQGLARRGLVRRILAGWTGPDYDLNAVFPRGQQSPKVRVFVDFLVERLRFDGTEALVPVIDEVPPVAVTTATGATPATPGSR